MGVRGVQGGTPRSSLIRLCHSCVMAKWQVPERPVRRVENSYVNQTQSHEYEYYIHMSSTCAYVPRAYVRAAVRHAPHATTRTPKVTYRRVSYTQQQHSGGGGPTIAAQTTDQPPHQPHTHSTSQRTRAQGRAGSTPARCVRASWRVHFPTHAPATARRECREPRDRRWAP